MILIPEKLSIEIKQEAIRKNWRLEAVDEVPFLIEIGPFHGATSRYFSDDAAELSWNVEFHRQREAVYDYGMPNIKPNQGINIIASAFGCPYTVNSDADPWVQPLIREENIDAVYALALPDIENNAVYKMAFDRVRYLESHSDLPLRLLNVPSPLVTASLIWDYTSFMESTILHPDEVHALMEKVTEATIQYVKRQLEEIHHLHTMGHEMWYLPREFGVRISDDTAALMSPTLYREFGVRYNNLISRAFGGIVVHSCGDVQNVVQAMTEIDGIVGVDLTIPQNPNWETIRTAVAGKIAVNLRHYYWDHENSGAVDMVEYSKKLVDFFGRKGVFIQTSTRSADEAQELGARLREVLSQ